MFECVPYYKRHHKCHGKHETVLPEESGACLLLTNKFIHIAVKPACQYNYELKLWHETFMCYL